jgi:uncharacterized DUF497 family protein
LLIDNHTGIPYGSVVDIDFDPAKDAQNIAKHGVSLSFAAVVLADAIGAVGDSRHDYRETRIKAFAQIDGVFFGCVYTMRDDVAWIISVHRVREREVRRWLGLR